MGSEQDNEPGGSRQGPDSPVGAVAVDFDTKLLAEEGLDPSGGRFVERCTLHTDLGDVIVEINVMARDLPPWGAGERSSGLVLTAGLQEQLGRLQE